MQALCFEMAGGGRLRVTETGCPISRVLGEKWGFPRRPRTAVELAAFRAQACREGSSKGVRAPHLRRVPAELRLTAEAAVAT